MSFFPNPTVNDGGRIKSDNTNDSVEGILTNVLKELKIMNFHLAIVTGNSIKKTEVD